MTNPNTNHNASTRAQVQAKYNNARANLLLMLGLTLLNMVLLVAGSDMIMLFSATLPFFTVLIGLAAENTTALIITLVIAAVSLLPYLLCWIFSKKHYGWLVAAVVLFALDTLAMALLYISVQDVSGIFDAVIHVYILYSLISGVRSGAKLKKLPADEPIEVTSEAVTETAESSEDKEESTEAPSTDNTAE